MRLEEIRLEADRTLIERLRIRELVASVVDVGQVDQGGHEIRIQLQRLSIRGRGALEFRLVPIVQERACAEILLRERRVARAGRRFGQACGRRRLTHPPLQREDFRGRGIEPEIELELSLARGKKRARDAAKRRAERELVVHLLEGRKVRKREERVRIGAKHRPDDPALDQIPQMILAKRLVARQEIPYGVILPLQRARRRHAGEPAEPVLV